MLINAVAFILVLGILVLVHEFGHFIMAKLFGVKVEEFSIGFPPRIFSFKKGETKYTIGLLPLGGYVQMLGEGGESKDKRAFNTQTPGKRFGISIAGVVMNIVLAWFILTIGFTAGMPALLTPPEKVAGNTISADITVVEVQKDSPAEVGGLKKDDKIISANNRGEVVEFSGINQFISYNKSHKGQIIVYDVKRDSSEVAVNVTLRDTDESQLGVQVESSSLVKVPFYLAPVTALSETWNITATTFTLLGSFVADVFKTGKVSDEVGGPVKIYVYTGLAVQAGFIFLMQFIALLSVNLALINILPIPALDGSKIFLTILEKLFGRKVIKESTENLIHAIGFGILIILILLITFKDLGIGQKITHIFK